MEQETVSSVYQLANIIGTLPTTVHVYLDETTKEIGFADVYRVLPQSLQRCIAGPWRLEKSLWDAHFDFSGLDDGAIKEFFLLLGYPAADIVSSWYLSNGIQTVLVSPWGDVNVSARKLYITLQEVESYYAPIANELNQDHWYVSAVLDTYKELSIPLSEDDPSLGRCVVAYEQSLNHVRGLLNAMQAHPSKGVSTGTIQFAYTVTKNILQILEKVKLPR